jgi:hypothetical protein
MKLSEINSVKQRREVTEYLIASKVFTESAAPGKPGPEVRAAGMSYMSPREFKTKTAYGKYMRIRRLWRREYWD